MSSIYNVWQRIDKISMNIQHILGYTAGFILFVMMLFVTAGALARYVFNAPLYATHELTEYYFMAAIVFLALGITFRKNMHVNIDIVYQNLPKSMKTLADILTNLIGVCFFLLLAYQSWRQVQISWSQGEVSVGIVPFPLYYARFLVTFGSIMLVMEMSLALMRIIINKFIKTH